MLWSRKISLTCAGNGTTTSRSSGPQPSYCNDYATRGEGKQGPRKAHKIILKKITPVHYYAPHHEDIRWRNNYTHFLPVLCT